MLTSRRSPTEPACAAGSRRAASLGPSPRGAGPPLAPAAPGFGGTPPRPASGVAHSEQNFAVGPLVVPQLGQAMASGVAHSVQNFAPGRFSVPQLLQITSRG